MNTQLTNITITATTTTIPWCRDYRSKRQNDKFNLNILKLRYLQNLHVAMVTFMAPN